MWTDLIEFGIYQRWGEQSRSYIYESTEESTYYGDWLCIEENRDQTGGRRTRYI